MALVLLSACSLYFGSEDVSKKGGKNGVPDARILVPDGQVCPNCYPDAGCYGSGCYYPDAAYGYDGGCEGSGCNLDAGCNGIGCYPDAAVSLDAGHAPDCHL